MYPFPLPFLAMLGCGCCFAKCCVRSLFCLVSLTLLLVPEIDSCCQWLLFLLVSWIVWGNCVALVSWNAWLFTTRRQPSTVQWIFKCIKVHFSVLLLCSIIFQCCCDVIMGFSWKIWLFCMYGIHLSVWSISSILDKFFVHRHTMWPAPSTFLDPDCTYESTACTTYCQNLCCMVRSLRLIVAWIIVRKEASPVHMYCVCMLVSGEFLPLRIHALTKHPHVHGFTATDCHTPRPTADT